MLSIPYDASRESLYHPGEADDFFQHGPIENDAALCAEMSRLAYVKQASRLKQYLDRAGFQLNQAIGYKNGGTQLFIASKQEDNLAVVVFRGTEPDDILDVLTDANTKLTAWVDDSGKLLGHVHKGFATALQNNDILGKVISCLDSMLPSTRVLLTGHSLGAALAALTASRIPSSNLYTFGLCRVGDAFFAETMQNVIHTRFVDCRDSVTRVPPEEFGYVHVGSLRYIDRNGQLLESPSEEAINADRLKAAAWYLVRYSLLFGNVFFRGLADHAQSIMCPG